MTITLLFQPLWEIGCKLRPLTPEGKFKYMFFWNRETNHPRKLLSQHLDAAKVWSKSLIFKLAIY